MEAAEIAAVQEWRERHDDARCAGLVVWMLDHVDELARSGVEFDAAVLLDLLFVAGDILWFAISRDYRVAEGKSWVGARGVDWLHREFPEVFVDKGGKPMEPVLSGAEVTITREDRF